MIALLYGRERFLKEEAVAGIKTSLFSAAPSGETDYQTFAPSKECVTSLIGFISTAPFLASHKLAVLWRSDELGRVDKERLVEWMPKIPAFSSLVIDSEQTNVNRDDFLKQISEQATKVVACHTPFEKDMPAWVEKRAKKRGLILERPALFFLADRASGDLLGLENLFDQLEASLHPRKQAKLEDVKAVSGSAAEEDIFRLSDYVLDGKKKEALRSLDSLYKAGMRAPEFVAAIAGQMERFRKALSAKQLGKNSAAIGEELRIPRPFQAAFFSRMDRLTLQKLNKLTASLVECDEAFKTGLCDERMSVERFILTS